MGKRATLQFRRRRVVTWTFGDPSRPMVLLVHGWAGRGGQLRAFVPPLLEAGFSVLTFDAPAHGASEGSRTNLMEFSDSIRSLGEEYGVFRGVVAHSLGGAAAIVAMARGTRVEKAAVIAAPSDPSSFFEEFLAFLRMPPPLRDRTRRRLEEKFAFRWNDFDLQKLASGLATPALVVHDRSDVEVPFENGVRIAAAWPGAEFIETSGLGHRRVLRDPVVVAHVASFLAGRPVRVVSPEIPIETDLYERDERRERIFAAVRAS